MTADQFVIADVRLVNLALWIALGADLWRHNQIPLSTTGRRLIIVVMVAGMAVLFIGAFAPTYLPITISRTLYTVYTGFAAMVALAVWRTWR